MAAGGEVSLQAPTQTSGGRLQGRPCVLSGNTAGWVQSGGKLLSAHQLVVNVPLLRC